MQLQERLRFLGQRLTLIRHARPRGRMANTVLAVREICADPSTAVVFVDLDDALADRCALASVRALVGSGHDVVLSAPFRPDAPTRVYAPNFEDPRGTFGGDVWIHLRAFVKRIFDTVPERALQLDGQWLDECEDYATMISVVERAASPKYVPEFWYWHERSTGQTPEEARRRDTIIRRVLALPSLRMTCSNAE